MDKYDSSTCTHLLALHKKSSVFSQVSSVGVAMNGSTAIDVVAWGSIHFLVVVVLITIQIPVCIQALEAGKCIASAHWLNDVLTDQKMFSPRNPIHFPTAFKWQLPNAEQYVCASLPITRM